MALRPSRFAFPLEALAALAAVLLLVLAAPGGLCLCEEEPACADADCGGGGEAPADDCALVCCTHAAAPADAATPRLASEVPTGWLEPPAASRLDAAERAALRRPPRA